jgi:chaperonin GroEL
MKSKSVVLDEEARERLKNGVRKFAAAVKSTLGPSGNTVIIKSDAFPGGHTVTKDGVTVASQIRFSDEIEDAAAIILRQACVKTAKEAGDGTTTSAVLAEAFVNAFDLYHKDSNMTRVEFMKEVKRACVQVLGELDKMKIDVNGNRDMIYSIAMVSSNGDEEISSIIADAYAQSEHVFMQTGDQPTTTFKVIEGIQFDRGYTSPFQVTDHRDNTCKLVNPAVLIYDGRIKDLTPISEILVEVLMRQNRDLLIIAELEDDAMESLNFNIKKNKVRVANINPPLNGQRRVDLLEKVARITGATFFSEDTGSNLQSVDMSSLGEVAEAIISRSDTVLKLHEDQMVACNQEKEYIIAGSSGEISEYEEEQLRAFSAGFGIITVGGATPSERKELADRTEDAICAARVAIKEGVVPGSGKALPMALSSSNLAGFNTQVYFALDHVASAPMMQLFENYGLSGEDAHNNLEMLSYETFEGYDMKNMEKVDDLVEQGIIDPLPVTKNALINALSVATVIVTSNCVIYDNDGN